MGEFALACSLSLSLSMLLAVKGDNGPVFRAACGNILTLLSRSNFRSAVSSPTASAHLSVVRRFCSDLYRDGTEGERDGCALVLRVLCRVAACRCSPACCSCCSLMSAHVVLILC